MDIEKFKNVDNQYILHIPEKIIHNPEKWKVRIVKKKKVIIDRIFEKREDALLARDEALKKWEGQYIDPTKGESILNFNY